MRLENQRIVNKSPWDTNLMKYLFFYTKVWKKSAAFLLKTGYFPPSLHYNVDN